MINTIENKNENNINTLNGIFLIFQVWEKLSDIIIQNCFRHTSFNNTIQQQVDKEKQEEQEISLPNIVI